ncbi:MAG: HD family hydrolase [Alphaproteobacteria bacterium]|nr:HD family hydrolase [Alphaproteobacteria bacterium]
MTQPSPSIAAPAATRGPWIQTHEGLAFPLINPEAADIRRADLVAALAKINRFTGHTREPYSVAQHSVLVAELVTQFSDHPDAPRYALLHDAHEAYLGDVATPVKWALREFGSIAVDARGMIEDRIDEAVHRAFGLAPRPGAGITFAVKAADLLALMAERRDLLKPGPAWEGDYPDPAGVPRIEPLNWRQAAVVFDAAITRLFGDAAPAWV